MGGRRQGRSGSAGIRADRVSAARAAVRSVLGCVNRLTPRMTSGLHTCVAQMDFRLSLMTSSCPVQA